MNLDNQHANIWQRIYAAPDASSVLLALREAGIDNGDRFVCNNSKDYDLVAFALHTLTQLAEDDRERAADVIVRRILPLLDDDAPDDASLDVSRCRQNLVAWIDSFPSTDRMWLEKLVLDYLVAQLAASNSAVHVGRENVSLHAEGVQVASGQPESACWTIAVLGTRRDDVVAELWRVVDSFPDSRGEAALSALSDLGLPRTDRDRLAEAVHHRIRLSPDGPPTPALSRALKMLATPKSIAVLAETWLAPVSSSVASSHERLGMLDGVALSVLGDIADAVDLNNQIGAVDVRRITSSSPYLISTDEDPRDIAIIEQAWRVACGRGRHVRDGDSTRVPEWVALGGDIAEKFNIADAVITLMREVIAEEGEDEQSQHARYLLGQRLSECVRPRQLDGWIRLPTRERAAILSRLHADAIRNSASSGPFQTGAGLAKEQAWQTLLRLGEPQVLNWAWDALSSEQSPYHQRTLLEMLSVFRMTDLPEELLDRVRERRDMHTDQSPGIQAQLGAIMLAASSATPSAFAALLNCGLRLGDTWLLNANQRLADAAVELARRGDSEPARLLWERVQAEGPDADRTAAAFALEELAGHNLLMTDAPHLVDIVAPLLQDERRSSYQRALLSVTLAQVLQKEDATLPVDVELELLGWATTETDIRGWLALQVLVQFDRVVGAHEDVLRDRLGLEETPEGWAFRPMPPEGVRQHMYDPYSTYAVSVLAGLYRTHPAAFIPAVAESLAHPRSITLGPLLAVLHDLHTGPTGRAVPPPIAQALVPGRKTRARTQTPQEAPSAAPTEALLTTAVALIPDRVAKAPFAERARDWQREARIGLANALGSGSYRTPEIQCRALAQLLELASDGLYEVRRAAYRAIARIDLQALAATIMLWQSSPDVDWRARAAEASCWLIPTHPLQPSDIAATWEILETDVERIVRETTVRSRHEQRAQRWAAVYAQQIAAQRAWEEWDNRLVEHLWHVGEAFVRLCDDHSLEAVSSVLRRPLPRHARAWLTRLYEAGKQTWEDSKKKWPEPWAERRADYTVKQTLLHIGDQGNHSRSVLCIVLRTDMQMTPDKLVSDTRRRGVLIFKTDEPPFLDGILKVSGERMYIRVTTSAVQYPRMVTFDVGIHA